MASGVFDTSSNRVTINGIIDHTRLINRNLANQHPISAISGLQEELDILKANTNQQVLALEDIVKQAKKELQDTSFEIRENYASQKGLEEAVDQLEINIAAKYSTKSDYLALYSDFLKVQSEVEDDIEKAIKDLKEALEREDSDLSKAIEDLEEALTTAESTLQGAIAAVQVNLNNTKAELQAVINANKADAEDKVSELNLALEEVISAYQAADNSLEERLTIKIEDADATLDDKIKTVQDNLDRAIAALKGEDTGTGEGGAVDTIASLKEALNTAIIDLRTADQENKAELEGKITDAQTLLQVAIDNVQTNLDNGRAELDKAIADLDAAMKKGDADLSAEIANLNTALTNAKVALEQADTDNKAELVKKIEDADKALDEAIKAVQKNLDDAKVELSNAANIYYIKNEDEQKSLDAVLDELYQGSGDAENITYDENKNVYEAIRNVEEDLAIAVSTANSFKTETATSILALRELIDKFHPIQLGSLSVKAKNGSAIPTTVEIGYIIPDLKVSVVSNKPINEIGRIVVEKQTFNNIKLTSQGDVPSITYTSTDISFAGDNRITLSENKNYSISFEANTQIDSQAAANWISKTYTIRATYPVFYGSGSSDITEFNSLTRKLSTTKAIGNVEVTVGNNEYFYFALPQSYGTPLFKVGGFEGGVSKLATSFSYTCNNVAVDYDVYRSTNSSLGKTTFNIS